MKKTVASLPKLQNFTTLHESGRAETYPFAVPKRTHLRKRTLHSVNLVVISSLRTTKSDRISLTFETFSRNNNPASSLSFVNTYKEKKKKFEPKGAAYRTAIPKNTRGNSILRPKSFYLDNKWTTEKPTTSSFFGKTVIDMIFRSVFRCPPAALVIVPPSHNLAWEKGAAGPGVGSSYLPCDTLMHPLVGRGLNNHNSSKRTRTIRRFPNFFWKARAGA